MCVFLYAYGRNVFVCGWKVVRNSHAIEIRKKKWKPNNIFNQLKINNNCNEYEWKIEIKWLPTKHFKIKAKIQSNVHDNTFFIHQIPEQMIQFDFCARWKYTYWISLFFVCVVHHLSSVSLLPRLHWADLCVEISVVALFSQFSSKRKMWYDWLVGWLVC